MYLKEDFNINDDSFETLVRGYIKTTKIFFYKTSFFKAIDLNEINEKIINDLLLIAKENFGAADYIVGNRLIVGKPGGDEWPAGEIIAKYKIDENDNIYKI